jgi:alkylation response protein AidB-like acyl-CoA dehydrogenase
MPHPYGFEAESLSLPLEVVARHGAAVDRGGRFPEEGVAALGAAGLLGLTVSAELGGRGQGPRAFAVAAEELAVSCASTAMVYVMHTVAIQAIASSAVFADRDAVLGAAARGEHLSTLALSERGSRSQFWAPLSKLEGNGRPAPGRPSSPRSTWSTPAPRRSVRGARSTAWAFAATTRPR